MLRGLAFLTAAAGDAQGGVNKVTQICPPPTGTLRYSNPLGISATSAPFHTERSGLDLQLDGTLNIAGGKRQHSQPGSLGPPATITLQWPAMVAKPQYNSTLPR